MSVRVLVTGATGALGRAVMKRISARPDDFTVFAPGRGASSDALDLRVRDQIARTVERVQPQWILHLAGSFSSDFDDAYAINVTATRHLLEAVDASGQPARVVVIGSAAEYGLVSPEENPIREDRVLRPVSTYGMSKAWQTELACLYAGRGTKVIVARVFNLLGQGLSQRLFVGRLHQQMDEWLRGERTRIEVGPLTATRDYISVDDAATQLLAIAQGGLAGSVYHVASGQPVTMRALLERELARRGIHAPVVVEDVSLTNRHGYDVPIIYADVTKTAALLRTQEAHAAH